jgi:DNA phosphorothioation-dependent restriction protein DptG
MKFILNREDLQKNLFKGNKIEHHTGNKIKLFPFPANATALLEYDVIRDLKDFKGIAGACFRECLKYSQKNSFVKDDFIQKICAMANAPENHHLKSIIEKVAFNEKEQLVLFDSLVYPHIRNGNLKENKTLNDIGKYLVALFFEDTQKEELRKLVTRKPDNLFYKLILACLPEPQEADSITEPYYQASMSTKALFQQDLKTLLVDPDLFISGFHQLLKFYLFKYITDLAIELNAFLGDPKDQLFFSVKWEKLQDFRMPLTNGWEMFERHIEPLFSHVVTLELINHIGGFENTPVSYQDIKKIVPTLSSDDLQNLISEIKELTSIYKSGFPDVSWEKFRSDFSKSNSEIEKTIVELFQVIEFQFIETKRDRAKLAYKNWMSEFTKLNFGRRRGQLGLSLALDHEFLLLLTRLVVGKEDRIRLNNLWEGLKMRGINFDNASRDHIISYFEKVNLLEKKSDSGDAQYIRKFNQTLV